jgi:hypothetical protein
MADAQGSSGRIISPEFFIPDNTEDFQNEVEAMMQFHAQIATRIEVVAAGIRKGLSRLEGQRVRPDLLVNARRVSRPIAQVAGAETACSKSWGQAWRSYVRLYGGGTGGHQRGWKV